MKTQLCILLLLCTSVFLPSVEARSYQTIINELRAEAKKGQEKTTKLEAEIKEIDKWAVDQWRRAEDLKGDVEKRDRQIAKLERSAWRKFWLGFGLSLVLSVVGIGLILSRRNAASAPSVIVSAATPHPADVPKRKRPSRRKTSPTKK